MALRTFCRILLLSIAGLFVMAGTCLAGIDPVRLERLGGNRVPLSWHNIHGPPEIISDVVNSPDKLFGHRFITLDPGQELLFRLQPRSIIRLFEPTGELAALPLAISISDGNGLFIDQPIIRSNDRTSLFVAPSIQNQGLARVKLDETASSAVSVALFTSYYQTVGTPLAYRTTMKLTAPQVKIRKRPLEAAQTYHFLEAGRPTQVRVTGPAHYKLLQRMIYDGTEVHRRVEYTVEARLNQARLFKITLTSEPETREALKVDGSYPPLSRSELSYFSIPEGEHVLTLVPSKSLYVRLLKKEPANFLFERLNNPFFAADQSSTADQLQADLFPTQSDQPYFLDRSPDPFETRSRQLWADSRHAQGGLVSAHAMVLLAERYPGLDDVQRYTRRTKGAHTYFREIIPQSATALVSQRVFTFVSPTLKSKEKEDFVLHPATAEMAGTNEPETSAFTMLETNTSSGLLASELRYDLPQRQFPSELRLRVIAGVEPQSFGVRIGTDPEILCQLRPQAIRPDNEFRPSREKGEQVFRERGAGGMTIPESPDAAAEIKRAATIVLPLRKPAAYVVIRRLDQGHQPIYISLQFRDSRPFDLTEQQYITLSQEAGTGDSGYALVGDLLKGYIHQRAIKYESRSELELAAFFRPLVRHLKTLVTDYTSSVYPLSEKHLNKTTPTNQQIEEVQGLLRSAVAQRQWVAVIEHSSFLFQATTGDAQQKAAEQLINGLLLSGEHYLAELHLKAMLLYSKGEDAHLAAWAKQRLEALYRKTGDIQSLASLYAVGFSTKRLPSDGNNLTQIFLRQGRSAMALRAALALREEDRRTDLVLQAALEARWWNLYQDALDRVLQKDSKIAWRALEKQIRGDRREAERLIAQVQTSQNYGSAVERTAAISANLFSHYSGGDQQAISDMEPWYQGLPGPRSWKREYRAIYQHAGGAFLYSGAQGLHTQVFRSEPDRPVRLRLQGPVTISTTIRPLHPAQSTTPINGWARLRSDQELDLIPIINNLPNQQWQLVADQNQVPGMAIEHQRSFGPGIHDISLAGDAISLLVSLKILRPVFADNDLPLYGAELTNHAETENITSSAVIDADRLACLTEDCIVILPEQPSGKPRYFRVENHSQDDTGKSPQAPATETPPYHAAHKHTPYEPMSIAAHLMAQNRWQEALEHLDINNPEDRDQTLILLAYLSELQPQQRIRYEVEARSLLSQFPETKNGAALLRRISAYSHWQQVPFVKGSAGLRLLPYQSWQPEAPSMRIRKALLREAPAGQTVLTGADNSILIMENSEKSHLELTFTLAELPYLKPESMSVAYQLDDNQPDTLNLTPEVPEKTVSIAVPSGRHRLSISIIERFANQYLWVNFAEKQSPTSQHPGSSTSWSTRNRSRAFHVVSPEHPVVATITGPAWVRVDELTNGTVNSTYHHIRSAVEHLTFEAEGPGDERLVRIFHRVADRSIKGDGLIRTTTKMYKHVPLPPPPPDLNPLPPTHEELADLPPPLPEINKSISAELSYHRRRDLLEDEVSDETETFAQLSAGVQKHFASYDLYTNSSGFLRRRELGGPTLGARGDYTWKIVELPLNLRVQAEALAQNPNASSLDLSNWDSVEWSAKMRFSAYQYRPINLKLKHRPMLSFFGRLLSTDDGGDYQPGALDQDIYTPYKADHRLGLQLSEYLSYRPWLDSQFNVRGVFALNEDIDLFEPDHLRVATAWHQLLGSYQLSGGYLYTRFFEDGDRPDSINRNDFTLATLWDPLFDANNWLRFHLKYRYQLETGEHTGMVGMTWYFDGNRAIFQQRPEDDPFNALRRIRANMSNFNKEK